MTDTQKLLADYAGNRSEAAFRELVARYVNFVYSTAIRLVHGDTLLAEDVAQTVFVDLARTAGRIPEDVMLGGWLHRHTCFVAMNALRGERRRQAREREAMEMNLLQQNPAADFAAIAPVLDDAINQLDARDRMAVLLRFFEQRDFRAVGEALGVTEDAARMRVNRALEKLQLMLKNRGIACTAMALGNTLTLQAVTAAPTGLAAALSGQALALAAGSGVGAGLAVGWLRLMASTKMKIALVSGAAAFMAVVVVQSHFAGPKPEAAQPVTPLAQRAPVPPPAATAFALLQARVAAAANQPPAPFPAPPPVGIPGQPGTGALELYSAITKRTILRGAALVKIPDPVLTQMTADAANAAAVFERELSKLGYVVILDGEKFVQIIPVADKDKPRANPPRRNPQSALSDNATNKTLNFPSVDLTTFLEVHAEVSSRILLRPANLSAPPITLVTAATLTTDELIYAMGVVLHLNGITLVADGDRFVQAVAISEAVTVKTNAPKRERNAELIDPASEPVLRGPAPTLDALMNLYAKQARLSYQPPSPPGIPPIYFEVRTPLTGAELLYAIEKTLNLNHLAIVRVNESTIRVVVPPGRARSTGTSARSGSADFPPRPSLPVKN